MASVALKRFGPLWSLRFVGPEGKTLLAALLKSHLSSGVKIMPFVPEGGVLRKYGAHVVNMNGNGMIFIDAGGAFIADPCITSAPL